MNKDEINVLLFEEKFSNSINIEKYIDEYITLNLVQLKRDALEDLEDYWSETMTEDEYKKLKKEIKSISNSEEYKKYVSEDVLKYIKQIVTQDLIERYENTFEELLTTIREMIDSRNSSELFSCYYKESKQNSSEGCIAKYITIKKEDDEDKSERVIKYAVGHDNTDSDLDINFLDWSSNKEKYIREIKDTLEDLDELVESYISNDFKLGTAGYVLENGNLVYMDEYHGEDEEYRYSRLPEFSNTHCEEDTCVRIFNRPNDVQYKRLEEIIDKYLDEEEYCKVEIRNDFYEVFSLRENACQDIYWDEKLGNWTGYKLVQIIKNYFARHAIEESIRTINPEKDDEIEDLYGQNSLYTESSYELKEFLYDVILHGAIETVKIVYFPDSEIYAFGDGWGLIHTDLINDSERYGLEPSAWNGERFIAYSNHNTDEEVIDYWDTEINIYVYGDLSIADLGYDYKNSTLYRAMGKPDRVYQFEQRTDESLKEKIVKKGSKWQVQSEKGRNMGTYDTKAEAEKRLGQIEYFKHKDESLEEGTESVYDNLVKSELHNLNEWLDKYGFEAYIVPVDEVDELEFGNSVGMFMNSIQDNASVFPIALNKEYLEDYAKENSYDDYSYKEELMYGIRGTLWHEAGHGIYDYLEDFFDMPGGVEECVEEFARYVEDSELYDLLQKYETLDEKCNTLNEDYLDAFKDRTTKHIERVNKYASKIDRNYPNHDSDKFNELFDGYSLMSKENVTEEEQAKIDEATYLHVLNNEHHCEHWCDSKDIEGFSRKNPTPHGCLDCSKMPEHALEEMCCDWCAMSDEFGNTPFEWFDKNKDTRWHFNEEQTKFILDTLHKLWDTNESLNESKQDIEKFKQWAGEDLANRFFKVKDRLKGELRDIYYWLTLEKKLGPDKELAHQNALDALEYAITDVELTPTKKERNELAKSGSEKIYNDDRWLVLKINTFEASVKYGKHTQWCITGTNSGMDGGRSDWRCHSGSTFYFFIDKKNNTKYALEYYDDNDWCLWDESDYPMVGKGSNFNSALDVQGEAWNPIDQNKVPNFPKIDGLPDLVQEFKDVARDEYHYDKQLIIEEKENSVLDALDKEILDDLDKTFGQEEVYMWSTYILPNGHFLNSDNAQEYFDEIEEEPGYEHYDYDDYLWAKYHKDYQLVDKYCMKMNVTFPYIAFPKNRPTNGQQIAFRKILEHADEFENDLDFSNLCDIFDSEEKAKQLWNHSVGKLLAIYTPFGDAVYDLGVSSADDILKDINKAYATGHLFTEDLNEAKGRNTFIFEGKKAWSGAVNTLDGVIEEVHSYKEAEDVGFHHSFYFSDEQLELMNQGLSCFFCVWNDGKIMINAMCRFNPEDEGIELDEKFLEDRIREQIKIITDENLLTEFTTDKREDSESLKEHVLENSSFDVFETESVYQAKNYLMNSNEAQRVFIDENLPVYLIGKTYECVHNDMIKLANENGIKTFMNDFDKKKICLLFVQDTDTYFDEKSDAIDDDYDTVYIYKDFRIYTRYQNFKLFELYKVLGTPISIKKIK